MTGGWCCGTPRSSGRTHTRSRACRRSLGDQILAHSVALHVTVDLTGRRAQRLERRGLGLGAGQLVHAPAGVPAYVLPCERRTVLGPPGRPAAVGSARLARRTRPPYSTVD